MTNQERKKPSNIGSVLALVVFAASLGRTLFAQTPGSTAPSSLEQRLSENYAAIQVVDERVRTLNAKAEQVDRLLEENAMQVAALGKEVARAETSVSLIMVLLTLIWASLMGAFGWVIKILRDQADPGKTAEALGRALEASSLNSSIRQLSDAMKEVKRLAVKSEAGSEPPPSQSAGAS